MPHKFHADHLARLMSSERRQELPPDAILRQSGLAPGQTLVDIGVGPGFFALPAARLVGPKGRVFGLDVSPVMLAALRKNAGAAELANIRAVRITETAPALPPAADVYLIVNTFHEFDEPAAYLAALRRAMTSASRLVIVDFLKKKTPSGPPLADRIPLSRMGSILRAAGFEVLKVFRPNDAEYGVVARRRS
ncbi:MAG: methyltransferase domain-containing protein [Candidatus Aminicenantes bacterium]|nr:methyltransferase domain-containing protein [Candidatus Aminicenantes bacterium]